MFPTPSTKGAKAPPGSLDVAWLGRVPYGEALRLQEEAVEARRRGETPDRLLLLEHPPVVTLGRGGREENLREAPEALRARGVELHRVSRGGDVTYHGPGQLVGYAVVDLAARGTRDVHRWLRTLEAALLDALGGLGVKGARQPGRTGVFVHGAEPARKLASIGVGLRGWVTWHGFALNATLSLEEFDCIVPCGLHDVRMTSVARELAVPPEPALFARVREAVAEAFVRRLGA